MNPLAPGEYKAAYIVSQQVTRQNYLRQLYPDWVLAIWEATSVRFGETVLHCREWIANLVATLRQNSLQSHQAAWSAQRSLVRFCRKSGIGESSHCLSPIRYCRHECLLLPKAVLPENYRKFRSADETDIEQVTTRGFYVTGGDLDLLLLSICNFGSIR